MEPDKKIETVEKESELRRAVAIREHLRFFDANSDDAISLRETQRGLERLGFGYLLSFPATLLINAGVAALGAAQRLRVNPVRLGLDGAARVRHPDTGLVDADGTFHEGRLDALFERYAQRFAGEALTFQEVVRMNTIQVLDDARRDQGDWWMLPAGLGATLVEWLTLWWVGGTSWDGERVLEKALVRRFYTDPNLLEELAVRRERERADRGQSVAGRARNFLQDWLL